VKLTYNLLEVLMVPENSRGDAEDRVFDSVPCFISKGFEKLCSLSRVGGSVRLYFPSLYYGF